MNDALTSRDTKSCLVSLIDRFFVKSSDLKSTMYETDELSQNMIERLNYYVYLYIDPRDDKIFYVGEGTGNRALSHLYDQTESKKAEKIREIIETGDKPRIEILRYGLSQRMALNVEAAVIDVIGIDNLTNEKRGTDTEHGRMGLELLEAIIDPIEADIKEHVILIRVNQLYRYGMSDQELCDATRGIWDMADRKYNADYAFSVFMGIVMDVYKIKSWHRAGTTPYPTRPNMIRNNIAPERLGFWEFIREPVSDEIRNKYRMKSVKKYLSSRNSFLYVNC